MGVWNPLERAVCALRVLVSGQRERLDRADWLFQYAQRSPCRRFLDREVRN